MPFSSDTFDSVFSAQLLKLNPATVLDVGAGAGKYGHHIKTILPAAVVDAIEPTAAYRADYNLADIYATVYDTPLRDYAVKHSKNRHNLVIFGDVLEHFFRSEATDYIDYFLYRSDWVICVWPTFMPQDDAHDNHYEIHKSNFNLLDLAQKFDVHSYEKRFGWFHWNIPEFTHCEYNYCLIKGYVTPRNTGL